MSAPTDSVSRPMIFRVFRYAAGDSAGPRFDTYELNATPDMTVLTALIAIQRQQDPSLAFRFSCRGAACGSCGMTVNGHCDLACRTKVFALPLAEIILEPLPNLEVIRDLVVEMSPFWDKYHRVRPWFQSLERGNEDPAAAKESRQSPRQFAEIAGFANCILCACCYGACPVSKRQPNYFGPAALANLWRFVADDRNPRPPEELEELDSEDGVWGCDMVHRCIEVCPRDVRPAEAIAGLRRRLTRYRVRKMLSRGKPGVLMPSPSDRGGGDP